MILRDQVMLERGGLGSFATLLLVAGVELAAEGQTEYGIACIGFGVILTLARERLKGNRWEKMEGLKCKKKSK